MGTTIAKRALMLNGPGRFNRACFILAFLWLAVTIPLGIIWRPTTPDFSQFYMGGLVARHGEWSALYPLPRPGSLDNPGLWFHSAPKPQWEALRRSHQVPGDTRFILPPPTALLFVPLTFLPYSRAFWIWTAFLSLCAWGVAIVAARLYRMVAGHPSRVEGFLALLIVLSPMTARAIRIGNVSPPIALSVGLALLALLGGQERQRDARAAAGMVVGALLKYATLIFTPLLLAMRRWRMLWMLAGIGLLTIIVTLLIAGPAPFVEFKNSIVPTLSRPSQFRGNQSLPGMLTRIYGRPLPTKVSHWLSALGVLTLGLSIGLLFRVRRPEWQSPVKVLAGSALLLGWLLVFSPISWEHWPIMLCPMWGWLVWEARSSHSLRRALAPVALLLMYLPAGILQVRGIATYPILLPEPYNSWQLLGVSLLFLLAAWRVGERERPDLKLQR